MGRAVAQIRAWHEDHVGALKAELEASHKKVQETVELAQVRGAGRGEFVAPHVRQGSTVLQRRRRSDALLVRTPGSLRAAVAPPSALVKPSRLAPCRPRPRRSSACSSSTRRWRPSCGSSRCAAVLARRLHAGGALRVRCPRSVSTPPWGHACMRLRVRVSVQVSQAEKRATLAAHKVLDAERLARSQVLDEVSRWHAGPWRLARPAAGFGEARAAAPALWPASRLREAATATHHGTRSYRFSLGASCRLPPARLLSSRSCASRCRRWRRRTIRGLASRPCPARATRWSSRSSRWARRSTPGSRCSRTWPRCCRPRPPTPARAPPVRSIVRGALLRACNLAEGALNDSQSSGWKACVLSFAAGGAICGKQMILLCGCERGGERCLPAARGVDHTMTTSAGQAVPLVREALKSLPATAVASGVPTVPHLVER